jgi:hypothetical protein
VYYYFDSKNSNMCSKVCYPLSRDSYQL